MQGWGRATPVALMGGPGVEQRRRSSREKTVHCSAGTSNLRPFSIHIEKCQLPSPRLAEADMTRCPHAEWALTVGLRGCVTRKQIGARWCRSGFCRPDTAAPSGGGRQKKPPSSYPPASPPDSSRAPRSPDGPPLGAPPSPSSTVTIQR